MVDAVVGSLSVPIDGQLAGLRHELGDTRHRTVAYNATAVSRFRRFFEEDEPDDAFRSVGVLSPVALLNSARPPAPSPAAITPAFLWERPETPPGWTQLVRRRHGRLRVELRRPWFVSGDGEQLAVLVVTEPTSVAALELEPFVTRVGRDPIWETPAPDRYVVASGLGAAAGAARAFALPEAGGRKAIVVPHDVWLAGDRWYADIDLSAAAASSYSPLIRLALARYQAHSSPDLELSSVVSTPFVPLLPERTLTVTRTDGRVVVLLEGVGPSGPRPNRVDVLLERLVAPAGVPASDVELSASEKPTDGTPAWVRMPEQSVNGALGAALPPLTLPAVDAPLRLHVREVEEFASDDTIVAGASMVAELGERLVFTDLVAV